VGPQWEEYKAEKEDAKNQKACASPFFFITLE